MFAVDRPGGTHGVASALDAVAGAPGSRWLWAVGWANRGTQAHIVSQKVS